MVAIPGDAREVDVAQRMRLLLNAIEPRFSLDCITPSDVGELQPNGFSPQEQPRLHYPLSVIAPVPKTILFGTSRKGAGKPHCP
jgi:hypothetical protein